MEEFKLIKFFRNKGINIDKKVRIRTTQELETRKIEFLKICSLLNKLEIKYFLQTGILLGAIRHKGFIPWDWDVELSVYADEVEPKMNELLGEIRKAGFNIEKYYVELSRLKIPFGFIYSSLIKNSFPLNKFV